MKKIVSIILFVFFTTSGIAQTARIKGKFDSEVDDMNRDMYEQVEEGIEKHPEQVKIYLYSRSISKHLERIADLATNIAEDVIYMIEGEIVRHKGE